jgi:hypothetical protein
MRFGTTDLIAAYEAQIAHLSLKKWLKKLLLSNDLHLDHTRPKGAGFMMSKADWKT